MMTQDVNIAGFLEMSPERQRAFLAGDAACAAVVVEALARAGSTAAQLRWAAMLLEGTGVAKDEEAAWRWFMVAARDGDAQAMNMVGRCYENGFGVTADFARAAVWYERAARAGDAWAQYNLGHLLLDGNGVARDHEAAFAWYCRAAAQDHPRAMNLVGRCFEEGWGTKRDAARAEAAFARSARAGYYRGQFNYASVLAARGEEVEARAWLEKALQIAPVAAHEKIMSFAEKL